MRFLILFLALTAPAFGRSVTLSWPAQNATCNNIRIYRVYRSGNRAYVSIRTLPLAAVRFTDASLADGRQYVFYVTRECEGKEILVRDLKLESADSAGISMADPVVTD